MEAHTSQEITEQLEVPAAQGSSDRSCYPQTLAEEVLATSVPVQAKHLAAYVKGRMLLAIAVVAFPGTAAAQNNPGGAGTTVAAGNCSELIVGTENYSSGCKGEVASVTLDDGTTMFVFSAGDRTVGFSGDGRAVTKTGVRQAQLPVQFLSIGRSHLDVVMPALGICRFGDPYSGPATLECNAKSELGTISARFVTDGRPPRKD